jgi:hypothetical protein
MVLPLSFTVTCTRKAVEIADTAAHACPAYLLIWVAYELASCSLQALIKITSLQALSLRTCNSACLAPGAGKSLLP